uniref:Uncharacterized protein n=1 Tax=Oryza glumipatula TaxID=40148 RepID=A0A0E0BFI6_9ORYZ
MHRMPRHQSMVIGEEIMRSMVNDMSIRSIRGMTEGVAFSPQSSSSRSAGAAARLHGRYLLD